MSIDATLWAAARDLLLEVEGGYVNHPNDPGGETKWGISKRAYPKEDIAGLTRERATTIYHQDYWVRIPADLPAGVRWFAFDCAVHHGVARAVAWLAPPVSLEALVATRLAFMAGLVTTWPSFGRGWVNRVARVLAGITAWEADHGREGRVTAVVLHGLRVADRWVALTTDPVKLRGRFVVTLRPGKVDVRRE